MSNALRRRRLTFSLASLFVVISSVMVVIGYTAESIRRERKALNRLRFQVPELMFELTDGTSDPQNLIPGSRVVWLGIIHDELSLPPSEWRVLGAFPSLRSLDLDGTDASTIHFRHWPILPKLESLDLSGCDRIDDMTVKELVKRCPSLQTIDLTNTAISDSSMSYLSEIETLRALNLSETKITGSTLGELRKCHIETLNLDAVNLDANAMEQISMIKALKNVSLSDTGVTGKQLLEMKQLRLEQLIVFGIEITTTEMLMLQQLHPACEIIGP